MIKKLCDMKKMIDITKNILSKILIIWVHFIQKKSRKVIKLNK